MLVNQIGNRLKVPNIWTSCGKIAAREHMKGGRFYDMTASKQVDFIEKVSKSRLGLDGMKIVVLCDKYRNGKYPSDISFDDIGKECLSKVGGKHIKEKYGLKEGIELNKRLHEERVNWMKKHSNNN